jgi:hypothetical protein
MKSLDELFDLFQEVRTTRARNDCPNCQGNKFGGIKVVVHERWIKRLEQIHSELASQIAIKDAQIAELEELAKPARVAAELSKKRK